MWSPRWTDREDVSNVCSLLLVEIARKSVTETADVGRNVSCWPTILWRCEGGRISNDYSSWAIRARQWRLHVHNLLHYMC